MAGSPAAPARQHPRRTRTQGKRDVLQADARERLLKAGLEMARERGLRGVTVRAVAQSAGANLGSFVYHFGTREAFVDELIERWYGPMFEGLRLAAGAVDDPLLALERTLLQLARWMVDNRSFLAALVLDAAAGERGAAGFLRGLPSRHPALLLELLRRAQRAGRVRAGDVRHQLLFIMGAAALPVIASAFAARAGETMPPLVRALVGLGGSPRRAGQRLEWALRGLAADQGDSR